MLDRKFILYQLIVSSDSLRNRYSYSLNISAGTFPEVFVLDYQGNTITSVSGGLQASSKSQTVSFNLKDAGVGLGLWAYTSDNSVSLSYVMSSSAGMVSKQINSYLGFMTFCLYALFYFSS
jgi:hypothetical protein